MQDQNIFNNSKTEFHSQPQSITQHGKTDVVNKENIQTLDSAQQFSLKNITEEALDEWIAQSANRPIISFLDPYKKFNAPQTLIDQLKKRWYREYQSKEHNDEKKSLLWDLKNQKFTARVPNYMRAIRQPKERQKDLSFDHQMLRNYHRSYRGQRAPRSSLGVAEFPAERERLPD